MYTHLYTLTLLIPSRQLYTFTKAWYCLPKKGINKKIIITYAWLYKLNHILYLGVIGSMASLATYSSGLRCPQSVDSYSPPHLGDHTRGCASDRDWGTPSRLTKSSHCKYQTLTTQRTLCIEQFTTDRITSIGLTWPHEQQNYVQLFYYRRLIWYLFFFTHAALWWHKLYANT